MKRPLATLTLLVLGFLAYGQERFPLWFTSFRDAVYNQSVSVTGAERLFEEAVRGARENTSGGSLYVMLSRCEYLLGKVYQDHGRKDEAVTHYETGIDWAEKALAENATAEAHEMIGSHYGQLCMIKSRPWVMANGLKVESNAKKALRLNSQNAGALYLIASRWAFGPGPFGDPERGIQELKSMLNVQAALQKDDRFNVYSALGYAYNRLNQYKEALEWTQKSLELYPANKFALDLQSQIQQKLKSST